MKISQFQYITTEGDDFSHQDQVRKACKGGVKWVQLRMKERSEVDMLRIANEVKLICDNYNAVFLLNDFVQVAKESGADGVHLGKEDLSTDEARKILGTEKIIGRTANTIDELREISKEDVNYAGFGPFSFTTTKKKISPIVGVYGYKKCCDQLKRENIDLPIIAIGGIQVENFQQLFETGVHGIAVSKLITKTNKVEEVVNAFQERWK